MYHHGRDATSKDGVNALLFHAQIIRQKMPKAKEIIHSKAVAAEVTETMEEA